MAQDAEQAFADQRGVQSRYDFYRSQAKFFRRVSGFLTERRAALDDLQRRWRAFQQQYQNHVRLANECFLRDDAAFLAGLGAVEAITAGMPAPVETEKLRELTGPFFEGALFYDERLAQTRSQQRCMYIDGPAVIRDSVRAVESAGATMHMITAGVDTYLSNAIFVNFDERAASQWEACAGARTAGISGVEAVRGEAKRVFSAEDLQNMGVEKLLGRFDAWRREFPSE